MELFGNVTTKQAGLLGTCTVFQSQWGTAAHVPASLDNAPSSASIFPHIPRLVVLHGLSFLLRSLLSSRHIITSPHLATQVMFKEHSEFKMRLVTLWGKTLCRLIFSVSRIHICDLNICIQTPMICTYCASLVRVYVCANCWYEVACVVLLCGGVGWRWFGTCITVVIQ